MHTESQCSTAAPDEVPDGASKGQPEEPCPGDQRTLRAAILGVPNAGKTTLVNQLLRQKVSKPALQCGLMGQLSVDSHIKENGLLKEEELGTPPPLISAAVCCFSKETHYYKECCRSLHAGKQPNSELCSLLLPIC